MPIYKFSHVTETGDFYIHEYAGKEIPLKHKGMMTLTREEVIKEMAGCMINLIADHLELNDIAARYEHIIEIEVNEEREECIFAIRNPFEACLTAVGTVKRYKDKFAGWRMFAQWYSATKAEAEGGCGSVARRRTLFRLEFLDYVPQSMREAYDDIFKIMWPADEI